MHREVLFPVELRDRLSRPAHNGGRYGRSGWRVGSSLPPDGPRPFGGPRK